MNKYIVVTGAAQGIGSAIASELLANNFHVIAIDNDQDALDEFAMRNSGIACIQADVADEIQVKNALDAVVKKYQRLDGIVNNAGISFFKPLSELSFEEWNRVIAVNLSSVFLFAKYAEKYLRDNKGFIINIASTRAFMSESGTEAYSASKGGVVALTHSLAISLGPEVKVNCVSPGWVDVSDYKKTINRKKEALKPEDHSQHPAGRVGEPKDIADMVVFLAKQEDSFITGQNFVIDGGMTKKMVYMCNG